MKADGIANYRAQGKKARYDFSDRCCSCFWRFCRLQPLHPNSTKMPTLKEALPLHRFVFLPIDTIADRRTFGNTSGDNLA